MNGLIFVLSDLRTNGELAGHKTKNQRGRMESKINNKHKPRAPAGSRPPVPYRQHKLYKRDLCTVESRAISIEESM